MSTARCNAACSRAFDQVSKVDLDSDAAAFALYDLPTKLPETKPMTLENGTPNETKARLAARIVRNYVAHHHVPVADLGGLIAMVRTALDRLGRGVEPEPEGVVPAVPIRRSVQRDRVICLDCGFQGQMLRRHLHSAHGLDPEAYRARWKLASDHPLTAPSYSEYRGKLAKDADLGHSRRRSKTEPEAP